MIIEYKGQKYNVINPGKLNLSVDQLSGSKMPVRYNKYIKKIYNISLEDYYVIVVFEGDESKIPICGVENCSNKCRFLNLKDGYSTGCSNSHAHVINNRERLTNGTHNFLDKDFRSRSVELVKSKVENGTHPFLLSNSKDMRNKLRSKLSKILFRPDVVKKRNESLSRYRELHKDEIKDRNKRIAINRVLNGTCPLLKANGGSEISRNRNFNLSKKGLHPWQKKSNRIISHLNSFIKKGCLNDICYFYIATLKQDISKIKIGISHSPNKRSRYYSNIDLYDSIEIIKEDTRIEIANLEYKVKLKFLNYSIGNSVETYPIDLKTEIINFINSI